MVTTRDFEKKTALVTGAGNRTGIGCAIASRLAACGANVVVTDLAQGVDVAKGIERGSLAELEARAAELRAEHGTEVMALPLDVADSASVGEAIAALGERFGRLDALFNNAGTVFGAPSALHEYDVEGWQKTLDVNLTGVLRVSQAALPLMLGAPAIAAAAAMRMWRRGEPFGRCRAILHGGWCCCRKQEGAQAAGAAGAEKGQVEP